ncbi:MAG: LLM class flavin-dependent oxidoreductase, partial [Candidatus Xenobia bacterium]
MSPTFGLMAPLLPPSRTVEVIVRLEALGWDRVWFPDHVLFPEPYLTAYDAWSVMAAAAVKTSRIQLGTSVSDPHRTHPVVFAQRAATVDEMSGGRVIVGLGAGEAMNLDPYRIPWKQPVSRMREFIDVLYGVLEQAPFTYEGKFFQVEQARLTVTSHQKRHLPLYLAALGPVTQRLAGERADGWMPCVVPAEAYAELLRPVREAAAGRRVEACGLVIVSATEDPRLVLPAVQAIGLTFIWPPILRRFGIEVPFPEGYDDITYTNVNPCSEHSLSRWEALRRA